MFIHNEYCFNMIDCILKYLNLYYNYIPVSERNKYFKYFRQSERYQINASGCTKKNY